MSASSPENSPTLDAVAVIPARHGSQRLPGKPLALIDGRPLIVHVVERALQARNLREVWVATDHEAIADAARAAGARAALTRADHATGSDRIGELLPQLKAEIIVNLQGDEPDIDPGLIDRLIGALAVHPRAEVATAASPWPVDADPADPNRVKVIAAIDGRALYFSRAPIPYPRGTDATPFRLHLGVYAYRRETLAKFLSWPRSPLERTEELEQLRLLEHGCHLQIVDAAPASGGIDTPEDLEAFRHRFQPGTPRRTET